MATASEGALGGQVDGSGLRLMITAISLSLLPFQDIETDHSFPTSLFVSLFGEGEDWFLRGQEIGGALLHELRLTGSMNTERAVKETVHWLSLHHPGAPDVRVERSDYRGAEVVLRLDYPPKLLHGVLQRVSWGTRGKDVAQRDDDPYWFTVRF